MKPVKIVVDRDIPFIKGVLEPYARVTYLGGAEIGPGDVRDADALVVRTRTRCDKRLLEGSCIRLIATATIGFDHIDMEYCHAHGIRVATSAGCNARGVLQWMGAALGWLSAHNRIASPQQTTVGVVGVGNVGSLIARYAGLWGFRVLCCDPLRERGWDGRTGLFTPTQFISFEDAVRQSDVVTFHVPLTRTGADATFGMASKTFFETLRPGAIVINSSRGEVIDESALLHAIQEGKCGCVIDTWRHEPQVDPALVSAALLSTPHIAGYSIQGKANGTAMAVEALAREFGWPLEGWYPAEAIPSQPRDISWEDMLREIPQYFDIEILSQMLKNAPGEFEKMRTEYAYRREFF